MVVCVWCVVCGVVVVPPTRQHEGVCGPSPPLAAHAPRKRRLCGAVVGRGALGGHSHMCVCVYVSVLHTTMQHGWAPLRQPRVCDTAGGRPPREPLRPRGDARCAATAGLATSPTSGDARSALSPCAGAPRRLRSSRGGCMPRGARRGPRGRPCAARRSAGDALAPTLRRDWGLAATSTPSSFIRPCGERAGVGSAGLRDDARVGAAAAAARAGLD
jgi:hypothetical protein